MEFTPEFITEQGFTPEQVTAITGQYTPHIAELKKGWDGTANEQAEGILTGAAKKITEITKVDREQGEKVGDFIHRAWGVHSKDGQAALETATQGYNDKVKNFKGDESLRTEFEGLGIKYSDLQKREAEFNTLLDSGVSDAHEKLLVEHEVMKLNTAFSNVKPVFSQDSNKWESQSKWDAFKAEVLTKYTIEIVEGEALAIDKENKYTTVKLKELVDKDSALTELVKGRQQAALDGKTTDLKDVEGVPFKVPAIDGDLTQAVQEYLASINVGKLDSTYTKLFAENFNMARAAQQKTA